MKTLFAVADCNNFFVSCEKVFRPELENHPVVVLSNNDGCVVSRSNEAKALGIPMGAPAFKYKKLFERNSVVSFSANFALYGDFSSRVMRILKQELDKVDVYSIDEAFIDIQTLPKDSVEEILLKVRKKILQWTGIPLSIGIGSTKTLAKAANEFAKKNQEYGGIFFIKNESSADEMLKKIAVSSVWGIGRKWSQKLISCGIDNAYKLKMADKNFVETRLNIMGKRTILELNGYSCVQITDIHATRKTILSSRSFGRSVFDFKDLSEAVSQYISIASRKLREHHLMASTVLTFVKTNHHKKEEKQYSAFYESTLESPSDFTPDLVKQAHYNLRKVYKKGYRYKKAGILLTGLIPKSDNIRTFFSKNYSTTKKNDRLMRMVDILNNKWGRDILKIGSEGIKKRWRMKSEMRSDPYTSDWQSLLTIKI